jgi:predicted RNA-binding Zn-ribbon protein involved in translation (DUF1610 family)
MKGSRRIGRPAKESKGKTKHDKEPKGPAGSEPASTPVHIPTYVPTGIEAAGPVKDPILSIIEEIRNLLINQFKPEPVVFKAYCRKCKDSRSVEDDEVWRVCPRCGEPLIIWNVEVQEAEK